MDIAYYQAYSLIIAAQACIDKAVDYLAAANAPAAVRNQATAANRAIIMAGAEIRKCFIHDQGE